MKTLLKLAVSAACFLLVIYACLDFSKEANSSEGEDCEEECEYTEEDYYEENGYEIIAEDITWRKEDNLSFDKPIVILNGKTLTIEKGAVVAFSGSSGIEVNRGKIIAEGTSNEKIVFKKDNEDDFYNLILNSHEYQSIFRYVVIEDGGSELTVLGRNFLNKLLIKTANAQFHPNESGVAAIEIDGGKLHMENCEFVHSLSQDIKVGYKNYWNEEDEEDEIILAELEVINTNFSASRAVESEQCDYYFGEHELLNDLDMEACKGKVYLKNNYYGDADGPNIDVNGEEEDSEKGFYLKGDFKLDDFKKNEMIIDPVIIIPGILGSANDTDGVLKIDPIWHKYDNLLLSLKEKGFDEGDYLFTFPYDWRRNNEYTAQLLRAKIKEVMEKTKISKVDLVTHSMGGLVARAYIEYNYDNNVDQFIMLGTPQKGSPEAYLKWEAGEGFFDMEGFLLKRHLNHEAEENNYSDLGSYIRERVLSVGELLPDYSYLWDSEENKLREYPNKYPRNYFLENLNEQSNLSNLKKVNLINIIGKTNSNETVERIKVITNEYEDKWIDGMPETIYDAMEDSFIMGEGDSTVPYSSARAIVADREIELTSNHTSLPTEAQCDIYAELSNNFIDENIEEEDQICKEINKYGSSNVNWLLFNVFSPIDIQVVDPNNKRIGKNFVTGGNIVDEIKDAYYSGHTSVDGEKIKTEFIVIPNPIDGEYKILIQGTNEGNYKIEVAKIGEKINDDGNSEVFESKIAIEGYAELDKEDSLIVEVKGDGVINKDDPEEDTVSPVIDVASPQDKIYQKNEVLDISYVVSDNRTDTKNISVEKLLDNQIITQDKIDLFLLKTGEHKLIIKAIDEAGNLGEKEMAFNVATDIIILKENINNFYDLKLIKSNQERKMLINNLSVIERELEFYNTIKNNIFIKSKIKKLLLSIVERQIDSHIDIISDKIKRDKKNYVTIVKEIIISDLRFIKNNTK